MIDLDKAKIVFNKYVNNYDNNNPKVTLKIKHTYRVMKMAKQIAISLKLNEIDVKLASLIGLLHDIGRFEQLRGYGSFYDAKTIDHGDLGVMILFEHNLINEFDLNNEEQQIVYQAIKNHNKYQISDNLSKRELLHCKIIRDSDKLDIFYTGLNESFAVFMDSNRDELEHDIISEHIFEQFMANQLIVSTTRKTAMDRWVSFLAIIYDLNFAYSYQVIERNDYINQIVNRLEYQNIDTLNKMKLIQQHGNNFIKNQS